MSAPLRTEAVAALRALDRLHSHLTASLQADPAAPYSITQVWVLLELSRHRTCELRRLRHLIGIDAGYLSRVLLRFEVDGLVVREQSAVDLRCRTVRLTSHGRAVAAALEARLVDAMATIREVIEASPVPKSPGR